MKRVKNLYEKIWAFDNLLLAFYKARKGKRNKPDVATFETGLEWELLRLQKELRARTYRPGGYTTFRIFDPKERMISAAPFRDRVVHHALCNIIEPIFEPTLIDHTYANRKGKGVHAGIRKCQEYVRRYPYVLKADIKKYFPSIDHAILKQVITRKIGCRATLELINTIIDCSNPQESVLDYFSGDDLFAPAARRKGLPMGNLTSQFFANLYLSSFDHFLKDELGIKAYLRYVDDFLIFGNNKTELHHLKDRIAEWLGSQFRLQLHERKSVVSPTACGVNFLGQRIFSTHRMILKANLRRFYRRTETRLKGYFTGQLSLDKMESQLNAWLGHAKQADTWYLRSKIFRWLYFECNVNLNESRKGAWVVSVPLLYRRLQANEKLRRL